MGKRRSIGRGPQADDERGGLIWSWWGGWKRQRGGRWTQHTQREEGEFDSEGQMGPSWGGNKVSPILGWFRPKGGKILTVAAKPHGRKQSTAFQGPS